MNKNIRFLLILVPIAVAVSALMLTLAAKETPAQTITVDDDGGANYTMIQDAIDAAEDGDTVRVFDGYYDENLVVDKAVSLIGNGSINTIINGSDYGYLVRISADWVNMSGFGVDGRNIQYYGIKVESNHTSIFENDIINSNIGIAIHHSTTSTIYNNNCHRNFYHGIFLSNSDYVGLLNNNCSNNHGGDPLYPWGGSIASYYSNNNTICNNNCSNNAFGFDSIFILGFNNTISNNTCNLNSGAGIDIYGSNNTISNNTCNLNGGAGIDIYGSNNTLIENICNLNWKAGISIDGSNNTIMKNICNSNQGKGIDLWNSNNNILFNNNFSNNLHGIEIGSSSNNTIISNTISANDVGIYLKVSSQGNQANYNNIYNNSKYGIDASENNGCTINATNNYWGDTSGPHHPVNNTDGKGDNVTDYVDFNPWLTVPYFPPEAFIDEVSPLHVLEGEEVHFSGYGSAYESILHYIWRSSLDGELHSSTKSSFTSSNLSVGNHTIYLKVQDNYGIWSDDVGASLVVKAKPRIIIIWPTNNTKVSGTIIINGNASVQGGTVEKVEISIAGGEWQTVNCTDSWSFEWDTTKYENGECEIKVRAFDGEDYSDEYTLKVRVENAKD
ncbi:MAG: right-handed parallel beta-helix repeat-containing protein, partial [Thermoplasmata archaeon]|nr:right-handed parallel beta-helix repeat-containing protein [Thermoplasmata archaeon]